MTATFDNNSSFLKAYKWNKARGTGTTGSREQASHRSGWATRKEFEHELERMTIPCDSTHSAGLVVDCLDDGSMLLDTSERHNLIIGGTGSGKSRRLLMQYVLSLRGTEESAVVFDPKGEIFNTTVGTLREDGFDCKVIDLRDPRRSMGWSMFSWLFDLYNNGNRDSRDRAREIMNSLAAVICPILDTEDIFWESAAQGLISGMGWTVLGNADSVDEVSLHAIYSLMNSVFRNEDSIESFSDEFDDDDISYILMSPALRNSPITQKCVVSTARQHLLPFVQSEALSEMLAKDDVRFDDVIKGKTIVYIIAPDEKDTMNPIVSIFITLLYCYIVDHTYRDGGRLRNRLHFLLDEFANLTVIPTFTNMITAGRSRNIRFTIVVQSLEQLKARYNKSADTIKGNCLTWVFLSSRDLHTLEEVSELTGTDIYGHRLLTPTNLQRFDSSSGEALVHIDRRGPFIGHLRDISEYKTVPFDPEWMSEYHMCGSREDTGTDDSVPRSTFGDDSPYDSDSVLCDKINRLLNLLNTEGRITNEDIEYIKAFRDYVGCGDNVATLMKLIELVTLTRRYDDALDAIRAFGYLEAVDEADEMFRRVVRPVRTIFAFLKKSRAW